MNDPGIVSAFVGALGWTLLHFVWQGIVIGAVYACAMYMLKGASSNTRYWTGMLTLAAMLAATLLTMSVQLEAATSARLSAAAPAVMAGPALVTASAPGLLAVLEQRVEAVLPWAVLAWFVGVMLLSGRLARDFMRIRRLAMVDVRPLPESLQRAVDRLIESLQISSAVRVLESARVAVPMVVGWLSPVVLLPPSALMGLTPRQLELIISHELAHVKRLDYLFNILQIVVETLLFYHPVVRMVSIRVRMERENCCDDIVVARTGDTLAYARALTEVEGLRCSSGMQLSLAATGGHLRGRVTRLVAAPAPQRGAVHWVAGLVLLASGLGAVSGARVALQEPPAAEPVRSVDEIVPVSPQPPKPPVGDMASPQPMPSLAAEPAASEAQNVTEIPMAVAPEAPAARVQAPRPETTGQPPAAIEPGVQAPASTSETQPLQVAMAKAPVAPTPLPLERVAPELPTEPEAAEPEAAAPSLPQPPAAETPAADDAAGADESLPPATDSPVAPAAPAEVVAPAEPAAPKITGGTLIKSSAPAYPRRARLKGERGFVTARYTVDIKGRVEDVTIVESTASLFERPVKRSLKKWRYEPFLADGEPIELTLERTFEFDMEGQSLADRERNARCAKVTGSRLCRSRTGYDDLGVVVVYNDP